ncbi:MAG: hypothetical protein R3B07_34790 [Polyangiaceae bacterium]
MNRVVCVTAFCLWACGAPPQAKEIRVASPVVEASHVPTVPQSNVVHRPGSGPCDVGDLQFSFKFLGPRQEPLADLPFSLLLAHDHLVTGVTDADGGVRVCKVEEAGDYCIEVGGYYIYASVTRVEDPDEQPLWGFFSDLQHFERSTPSPAEFRRRCDAPH